MKKFICEVTRTDRYSIEIDDSQLNEEWLKNWTTVFYDFDSLKEHAEHIAQNRARFQCSFIEGYGVPLVDGKKPWDAEEKQVEPAINIVILSEDDDCDVWVTESE